MSTSQRRLLVSRAQSETVARMAARRPSEWREIRAIMLARYPQVLPNSRRFHSGREMRRRHEAEWWEIFRSTLDRMKAEVGWVPDRSRYLGRTAVKPRPALKVVCPSCQAHLNKPCRTLGGRVTRDHSARRKLAQS